MTETSGSQGGPGGLYGEHYFAHACGRPYQRDDHWLGFFGAIADRIVSDIQPCTVLDVGCAMGFLVEALRNRGVECYGIDVSDYAIQQVEEDVRGYCWEASVVEPLPRNYDLIICIEVIEHLPAAEGERALGNLCQHTDDILFSSTPDDYGEATHVHVMPPEHWAEVFARHGFLHDVDFDASFVAPWAMRFRRTREPFHRLVKQYERRLWRLQAENASLRTSVLDARCQRDGHQANRGIETGQTAQALESALAERDEEIARLQELVTGYEQGRFIRLMRWVARVLRREH